MYYVHKHEVALAYGGPEEGGWWYTEGFPVPDWEVVSFVDEEEAFAFCRLQNEAERERGEREEEYDFTSVLADRSTHYAFSVEEYPQPKPFPETRPHYE